jgi:hypothetical protein
MVVHPMAERILVAAGVVVTVAVLWYVFSHLL